MDNHNSIGTCATSLTNATVEIYEETNNTAFTEIIDVDESTVVSALTEATSYISQKHLKDSRVNLDFFCSGSPHPSPSTPMEMVAEQEDNDEVMETGIDSKNDDS